MCLGKREKKKENKQLIYGTDISSTFFFSLSLEACVRGRFLERNEHLVSRSKHRQCLCSFGNLLKVIVNLLASFEISTAMSQATLTVKPGGGGRGGGDRDIAPPYRLK